jgi:hypothetical protein
MPNATKASFNLKTLYVHHVFLTVLYDLSLCRCDQDQRRCLPTPLAPGTSCGKNNDYFEACNEGPGVCKTVESEFGNYGICVGTPRFGARCDDNNECTKNDKCRVLLTSDGKIKGHCLGKFDASLRCFLEPSLCLNDERYYPSSSTNDVPCI